jgi:hypothetical protein
MEDKIHPVVELLAARMESNPEEFAPDGEGRWAQWLDELISFVTEEERVMLRKPMMQSIHEEVLDELMNGPDKRRKAAEDREYERHLAMAMQHTQRQAMQGIVGAYSGGGGGGGAGAGLVQGTYDYDLDKYRNTPTGSITSAIKPKPSPYDKIMNALKKGK